MADPISPPPLPTHNTHEHTHARTHTHKHKRTNTLLRHNLCRSATGKIYHRSFSPYAVEERPHSSDQASLNLHRCRPHLLQRIAQYYYCILTTEYALRSDCAATPATKPPSVLVTNPFETTMTFHDTRALDNNDLTTLPEGLFEKLTMLDIL